MTYSLHPSFKQTVCECGPQLKLVCGLELLGVFQPCSLRQNLDFLTACVEVPVRLCRFLPIQSPPACFKPQSGLFMTSSITPSSLGVSQASSPTPPARSRMELKAWVPSKGGESGEVRPDLNAIWFFKTANS